jgi:phosphopantothenoylcysteine decarboxylase/phosphopantothenate--cysteine ligase
LEAPTRIVLGVAGGIAAYKSVTLLRRLCDAGYEVTPILTESAQQFVGVATFSALASHPAKTSLFRDAHPNPHTSLGRGTDLVVVAPATARLIGQLANGLSDDLLSTTLLATEAPVVVAPAMHQEMWHNQAVQRNVAQLRADGRVVVPPGIGALAGGDVGEGRMAEPEEIFEFVRATLSPWRVSFGGRKIVITAGGTREPIDPVRYVGNRSSGTQGHAFAKVAAAWGAEVILITTIEGFRFPGVRVVEVETAAQMAEAVSSVVDGADIMIATAAVADFRPQAPFAQKLKRNGRESLQIELVRTDDVLGRMVSMKRDGQVIIGFAAETERHEEAYREKLRAKGVSMLVGNDVSDPAIGFGTNHNVVSILVPDQPTVTLPARDKRDIASEVLARAAAMLRTE